jgi:hypothetical protein
MGSCSSALRSSSYCSSRSASPCGSTFRQIPDPAMAPPRLWKPASESGRCGLSCTRSNDGSAWASPRVKRNGPRAGAAPRPFLARKRQAAALGAFRLIPRNALGVCSNQGGQPKLKELPSEM